jgi:succinoglycan biosynthesis transport protein ExoP
MSWQSKIAEAAAVTICSNSKASTMKSLDYVVSEPSESNHLRFRHLFNVRYLLWVIRRDWLFPVIGVFISLMAAATYIVLAPSLYNATAKILIDQSVNRYLQASKIIDEPILEYSDAGSQVFILSSESIIVPVVRSLGLAHDPEFVGVLGEKWNESDVLGLWERILSIAKFGRDNLDRSDETLERIAVEKVLSRLSVLREDVPNVITVTFASEDSRKAAAIANAIGDEYLASNHEAKSKSTKLAAGLLTERLDELKQQAADAERVLQDFKLTNNLISSGKAGNTANQVATLGNQLSLAQAAEAEARARLDLVQRDGADGNLQIPQVTDNDVILRLRSQYLGTSNRVGGDHDAVIKLKRQLDEIRASIQEEQQRIASKYAGDYDLAKARREELAATMAQLSGGEDSAANARMRELESAAETLRTAYNTVFQRLNEVNRTEDPVGQEARIITRAAPPVRKASRKSVIVLAGGLAFGLLLGIGVSLGNEFMSDVIRTPSQLREFSHAYCAVVPTAKAMARKRPQAEPQLLEEFVLEAPFSRFSEAFRNIRVILASRKSPDRGVVVCVVSAVAKEGKTLVATNLGTLIASSTKQRALLIDGDLHIQSLTKKFTAEANEGLLEALKNPNRLTDFVAIRNRSGLHFLPCPFSGRPPNAAELLGSVEMEQLLRKARECYDFVILELPPIMSVVDTKMVEMFVDQFVFVVEWGETNRRLIEEALSEVDNLRDRLACVVLNKVDPKVLHSIEAYKGPKFSEYYNV